MKIDRLIAAFAFIAALSVSPTWAQHQPANPHAAPPQTSASVPESKIAVIYSDAFLDAKTGIARFTTLLNTLNREFQPRQTELQQLQQKVNHADRRDRRRPGVLLTPRPSQLKSGSVGADEDRIDNARAKTHRRRTINVARRSSLRCKIDWQGSGSVCESARHHRASSMAARCRWFTLPIASILRALSSTDFNSKNPATASVTPPQE